MKIGVDLDATITAYPEFFSAFTKAMARTGHEIHIITNRPPGSIAMQRTGSSSVSNSVSSSAPGRRRRCTLSS